MKGKLTMVLAFITLLIFNGVQAQQQDNTTKNTKAGPTANFTVTSTNPAYTNKGCSNQTGFTFTNTSTGTPPLKYKWNFGDGDTSALQNPTHTYTFSRTVPFTVSLIVIDGNGFSSDPKTFSISVSTKPTILTFVTDSTLKCSRFGTVPLTAYGSSPANRPITYKWNYGDGATGTGQTSQHLYNSGTYNVELIATDDHNCKDSLTINSLVEVQDVRPDFSFKRPIDCTNDEVEMINNTIINKPGNTQTIYQWMMSSLNKSVYQTDVTTDKATNAKIHIGYKQQDDYNVELTVFSYASPKADNSNRYPQYCQLKKSITHLVDEPIDDFTATPDWVCNLPSDSVQLNSLSKSYNTSLVAQRPITKWRWVNMLLDTVHYTTNPKHSFDTMDLKNVIEDSVCMGLLSYTIDGCRAAIPKVKCFAYKHSKAIISIDTNKGCAPIETWIHSKVAPISTITKYDWKFFKYNQKKQDFDYVGNYVEDNSVKTDNVPDAIINVLEYHRDSVKIRISDYGKFRMRLVVNDLTCGLDSSSIKLRGKSLFADSLILYDSLRLHENDSNLAFYVAGDDVVPDFDVVIDPFLNPDTIFCATCMLRFRDKSYGAGLNPFSAKPEDEWEYYWYFGNKFIDGRDTIDFEDPLHSNAGQYFYNNVIDIDSAIALNGLDTTWLYRSVTDTNLILQGRYDSISGYYKKLYLNEDDELLTRCFCPDDTVFVDSLYLTAVVGPKQDTLRPPLRILQPYKYFNYTFYYDTVIVSDDGKCLDTLVYRKPGLDTVMYYTIHNGCISDTINFPRSQAPEKNLNLAGPIIIINGIWYDTNHVDNIKTPRKYDFVKYYFDISYYEADTLMIDFGDSIMQRFPVTNTIAMQRDTFLHEYKPNLCWKLSSFCPSLYTKDPYGPIYVTGKNTATNCVQSKAAVKWKEAPCGEKDTLFLMVHDTILSDFVIADIVAGLITDTLRMSYFSNNNIYLPQGTLAPADKVFKKGRKVVEKENACWNDTTVINTSTSLYHQSVIIKIKHSTQSTDWDTMFFENSTENGVLFGVNMQKFRFFKTTYAPIDTIFQRGSFDIEMIVEGYNGSKDTIRQDSVLFLHKPNTDFITTTPDGCTPFNVKFAPKGTVSPDGDYVKWIWDWDILDSEDKDSLVIQNKNNTSLYWTYKTKGVKKSFPTAYSNIKAFNTNSMVINGSDTGRISHKYYQIKYARPSLTVVDTFGCKARGNFLDFTKTVNVNVRGVAKTAYKSDSILSHKPQTYFIIDQDSLENQLYVCEQQTKVYFRTMVIDSSAGPNIMSWDTVFHTDSLYKVKLSSFKWYFENKKDSSSSRVATYKYTDSITDNVSLKVVDYLGCDSTYTMKLKVYEKPRANFHILPQDSVIFCYPYTEKPVVYDSTLIDTSNGGHKIAKYCWLYRELLAQYKNKTLKAGDCYFETQNPALGAFSAGVFDVGLIVTSNYNCKDTIVKDSVFRVQGPNALFEFIQDTLCWQDTAKLVLHYKSNNIKTVDIHYDVEDIVNWQTDVADISHTHTPITDVTPDTIKIKYQTPGLHYWFIRYEDDKGCAIYYPVPSLILADSVNFGSKNPVAVPDTIYIDALKAYFDLDSACGAGDVVTLLDRTPGNVNYRLWILSDNNVFDTIPALEADTIPLDSIDAYDTIQKTYNYIGGPNMIKLIAISDIGCSDTVTKHLYVYDPPVFSVAAANDYYIVCPDSLNQVFVILPPDSIADKYNYTWTAASANTTFENSAAYLTNVAIKETDSIFVRVQHKVQTCYSEDALQLVAQEYIELSFGFYDPVSGLLVENEKFVHLPLGDTVVPFATASQPKTWNDTIYWLDAVPDANGNVVLFPQNSAFYKVYAWDSLQCKMIVDSLEVDVTGGSVDVPSAFMPGSSIAENKVFKIRGHGIKEILEFKIYNRWGQLVFETLDLNQGWDGTYQGKLQNVDSYTYSVVIKTIKGDILKKTGTVVLVK